MTQFKLKRFFILLEIFGINLKQLYIAFLSLPWFLKNIYLFIQLKKQQKKIEFSWKIFPIFTDRFESSGYLKGHYFHQDLMIAQKIFENKPANHLDIGSSIYGFVSHVASFRLIEVVDIRDNTSQTENIKFKKLDIMNFEPEKIQKYDSISCLHVVEHFGLGRYNDKINYNGHIVGLKNIAKINSENGFFYLSTPIGKATIYFNAHRVFNVNYILKIIEPYYKLLEFHFVDDNGILWKNQNAVTFNSELLDYGCGIFILRRNNIEVN